MDNQIKIRGYRIELGEIEAVLRSHPAVRQCAVAAREDAAGGKRLIGYVVMQLGVSVNVGELRNFLKQKLPDYMIPSGLMQLDELPLLPNGKIDRRALPEPDQNRPDLIETYQAPRMPLEEALAKIWAELLKVDKVGIADNFFDLGGHSLLATQIVSRIRSVLSIELPLRVVFESPTIEQTAAFIAENCGKRVGEKELRRMIGELDALSDEETQRLLVEVTTSTNCGGQRE
jgi:acyl carrier protein